jgi:hypothetical protein
VDEAGEAIGRYAGAMAELATRSRHDGHSAVFVVQRAALLDRTVRDQCRYIAAFSISAHDAKTLAMEWPQAGLEDAVALAQFEYLWASRFGGPAKRGIVKLDKHCAGAVYSEVDAQSDGRDDPDDGETE